MLEFLGTLATTILGILGSLWIAFKIYARSRADQLSQLETVLAADRKARDEQANRDVRARRIDGLYPALGTSVHAVALLAGALRREELHLVQRATRDLRAAIDRLEPYLNIELIDRKGMADGRGLRESFGFAMQSAAGLLSVSRAASQKITDDNDLTGQLARDTQSLTSVLFVALGVLGEHVSEWERNGVMPTINWPTGEYVDRVFAATESSKASVYGPEVKDDEAP